MVYAILKKQHKAVGIFTSPHLLDIRERFVSDTGHITQDEFLECVNRIEATKIELSYFERCTLIAFLFFELRMLEYAIVEVWVWWLLDSSNIVHPYVTAITSISLDHTEILWDTLEEISQQKAGIIKAGIPVIYNHENSVIAKTAQTLGAPIIYTDKKYSTNLLWDHQQYNAAIAYEIARYIGISHIWILSGLQEVKHRWRLQYLRPNLIIDGAHNIESIRVLKEYIDTIACNFDTVVYCFALKKWKSPDMITEIFWLDSQYILIDTANELCAKPDEIIDKLPAWIHIKTSQDIITSISSHQNILSVVFWSLYMIGDFYT